MISYEEQLFWHNNSYGSAFRIPARVLQGIFVFACIITPATNWLIPLTKKIVRQDMVLRHNYSRTPRSTI